MKWTPRAAKKFWNMEEENHFIFSIGVAKDQRHFSSLKLHLRRHDIQHKNTGVQHDDEKTQDSA
jgi:hypothetical protein